MDTVISCRSCLLDTFVFLNTFIRCTLVLYISILHSHPQNHNTLYPPPHNLRTQKESIRNEPTIGPLTRPLRRITQSRNFYNLPLASVIFFKSYGRQARNVLNFTLIDAPAQVTQPFRWERLQDLHQRELFVSFYIVCK